MRRVGVNVSSAILAMALVYGSANASPILAPPAPMPALPAPAIPEPKDIAYPGALTIDVDATDLTHGVFHIKETIPVSGDAPMVLSYPRWVPGSHLPGGGIDKLGGLIIYADGKRVDWKRDPLDISAFHVDPHGAKTLELDFQFLSAQSRRVGRVMMTPEMLSAPWILLAMYPAGYFTRDIDITPSIKLPEGWKYATALETRNRDGAWTHFKKTSFETFADSPLIAGKYLKRYDLDPGGRAPVHLDVAGDTPEDIEVTPEELQVHRNLVQQAYEIFGSHHYDHYDFLLTLSDKLGGAGLEHHQSSDDGASPSYFTDWAKNVAGRDLLSHEFTHSWNGKFRRGADLWTPTFNVPMRNSLLWVYEGQTEYWGLVLAARSGLFTKQDTLDSLAMIAATYDHRIGRAWKPLIDTTNDPLVTSRRPQTWLSWQRSEDYYYEGLLIWLDVDTLIREKTQGKRSLSDFAKLFFGIYDGSFVTQTYTFDDVVEALNTVERYDWASFLRNRLEGHGPGAPLDGLRRGGYRLVYTDVQSDYAKAYDNWLNLGADFQYSLGFNVSKDGQILDVLWDGPAFRGGLTPDAQLIAVNGESFTVERLGRAVVNAKGAGEAVQLVVKANQNLRTVIVNWHEGLKYPHLEKIATSEASLDRILAPVK